MKKVILSAVLIPLVSSLIPLLAAEGGEGSGFGAWRLSVGGALNGGVKANVRSTFNYWGLSTLPAVGNEPPKWQKREGIVFGDDAFINPNSEIEESIPGYTCNWHLPERAVTKQGGGNIDITSVCADDGAAGRINNDDQYQPGISVELSRTLWTDESWGVDLALAVSYFFGNDIYSAHGTTTKYTTSFNGGAAFDPDYATEAVNGWYGYKSFSSFVEGMGPAPWIDYSGFLKGGTATQTGGAMAGAAAGGSSFSASGDYSELEMMLMLRPWYEITDWWRVFGEVGVALSRSEFEFSYSAIGAGEQFGASEDFSEWRCYGVAGAGTMFRLGSFDLSVDFLGRFLNDDLDCNGRNCQGSVEKADWVLRAMAGFEF